jgi:ribosomal protein L40E
LECRENASPASIHRHKKNKKCIDCSADISKRAIRCRKCNSKSTNTHPTKIIWPPIEKLVIMVKNEGYSSVGRKLKVSDNSVRKRLKSNGKL